MTMLDVDHPAVKALIEEEELLEPLDQDELIVGGRYRIWFPGRDKPVLMTRVTTMAETLEDQRGLTNYRVRQTALGLAKRGDIIELILSVDLHGDPKEVNKQIDRYCMDAEKAADSEVKANRGTASHGFMARLLTGETSLEVAPTLAADIDAMVDCLKLHGLTPLPDLIEAVLVCPQVGAAGRCDLVVVNEDGELFICDFKTGHNLYLAQLKTSIQLAIYAHAETVYDHASRSHKPMPGVRQDIAYAIHRPLGTDQCDLIAVDIDAGWRYVELAKAVRAARNHGRRKSDALFSVVASPEPITAAQLLPTEQVRIWVKGRLDVLRRDHPEAAQLVAELWPTDVPSFKSGHQHTDAELRLIANAIDYAEAQHEVPFGATDPATTTAIAERTKTFLTVLEGGKGSTDVVTEPPPPPPAPPLQPVPVPPPPPPPMPPAPPRVDEPPIDEGRLIEQQDLDAVLAAVAKLPPVVHTVIGNWARQAADSGTSFSIKALPSVRRFEIYRALIALAPLIEDTDLARATVGSVIPEAGLIDVPMGEVLARISTDQAKRITETARLVQIESPALEYAADGARVSWRFPDPPVMDTTTTLRF